MNEHDTVAAARAGALIDGRYRLEELIGEGAMGTVWRASDESLERTVAVKLFRAGIAGETDAVRRESEKKLLASLSHPALVTLFDARISERDASYLVMEYIAEEPSLTVSHKVLSALAMRLRSLLTSVRLYTLSIWLESSTET